MKNIIKKSITTIVILAMTLTLAIPMQTQAATKVKLNMTNAGLTITDKTANTAVQLKVKGTSQKVTWASSNKEVAAVNKNGKVVAKKKGTAVVSAKVNSKTYQCNVTVTDKHKHDYFRSSWHLPVCDLEGYIYYCCRICYDKYKVVPPPVEHNYVEVSQSVESTTGKSVTGYRCTKCDRTYRQYTGPRIDYKKYHLHCHCGMDFSNSEDHIMHSFYALVINGEVNGHSTYNWLCCPSR